jgi:hypothetical protein
LLSKERNINLPRMLGEFQKRSWNQTDRLALMRCGSNFPHATMTIILLFGIVIGCGLMLAAPIATKL